MTDTAPKLKSKKTAWIIWFFLGMILGGHRIYLNRMGSGLFIMTIGFFFIVTSFLAFGLYVLAVLFIWWIYDGIRLNKMVDAENEYILSGADD